VTGKRKGCPLKTETSEAYIREKRRAGTELHCRAEAGRTRSTDLAPHRACKSTEVVGYVSGCTTGASLAVPALDEFAMFRLAQLLVGQPPRRICWPNFEIKAVCRSLAGARSGVPCEVKLGTGTRRDKDAEPTAFPSLAPSAHHHLASPRLTCSLHETATADFAAQPLHGPAISLVDNWRIFKRKNTSFFLKKIR
jgi:hypothetical protein